MGYSKLLSVVVPTKNRYKYLKYLMELIASFDSDDIELVIQDNSDDNSGFVAFLDNHSFDFVSYDYTQGQIPMSENSDKAVLNSSGEYICFLGDDDGVTRLIIEGTRWMKKNNLEAVIVPFPYYYWPDASQGMVNYSAEMYYNNYDGKIKYLSAYDELIKVLKEGIPNRGRMPMAYHSVISRKMMDAVYEKCGTYFPGNSPDISNAVALSLVVNKFAFVNSPWVISGKCLYGGGGEAIVGNGFPPQISDMKWFRNNAENEWDARIPRIAIGDTIWAESAISALKEMGRSDLEKYISFNKMYGRFRYSHPQLINYLTDVTNNNVFLLYEYCLVVVNHYMNAALRRINSLFNKKTNHMCGLNTIIDAQLAIEKVVSKDNK